MKEAGWIVAALLAALGVLAFILRARVAAALGYEPGRASAPVESSGEGARRAAPADVGRDRAGGLRDLADLEVSDVMVHRTNMRSVNADDPPETVESLPSHGPKRNAPVRPTRRKGNEAERRGG